MSVRRLWPVLLLVPLGLVTGHQAVYAAFPTHTSGGAAAHSHGHIGVLASLALPLALAGAGWLGRRAQRDLILPALALLVSTQVVAFAAMETIERVAVGGDVASLVRSPVLWAGVAFQGAVALAVGLSVGATGRAATVLFLRATTAMTPAPRGAGALRPSGEWPSRRLAVTRWILRRGPPFLLGC